MLSSRDERGGGDGAVGCREEHAVGPSLLSLVQATYATQQEDTRQTNQEVLATHQRAKTSGPGAARCPAAAAGCRTRAP
eukprot:1750139-Rhodomonas_salina.1